MLCNFDVFRRDFDASGPVAHDKPCWMDVNYYRGLLPLYWRADVLRANASNPKEGIRVWPSQTNVQ
jgi:hypothetical protein